MTETPLPPAPAVPAQGLGDRIWLLLGGQADQPFTAGAPNLFRGQVTKPPKFDDGTVRNYAALYDSPAYRTGSRLGARRDRIALTFQVTCVGRGVGECLWTVDRVVSRLTSTPLEVPGRSRPAWIREDESNRSRAVAPDEAVDPVRFFVPLLFNLHA